MKTKLTRYILVLWVLGWVTILGTWSPARAHSTKGRVKVPLDKEVIVVDDVAYFAESYVHRHLYDDRTRETQNRYFIKDFTGLDLKDARAEVRFQVLDKKTNETFNDSLTIERGEDGTWRYRPAGGGAPLEVYTYIPKGGWVQKYAKWIYGVAGVLCCGMLARGWYRERRGASGALQDESSEAPSPDGQGVDESNLDGAI